MADNKDIKGTKEYEVDNEEISTNHDGNTASKLIAEYIVDTPRNKISELTPLSLDQHRPHSLISMLGDVLRVLCQKAVDRQKRLNAIYAKYNKDEDGKSIYPIDIETDPAWDVKKLGETCSEKWSYLYKQIRRGYKNELLMAMTTLAQVQMESEPQANPEDILKKIVKDRN